MTAFFCEPLPRLRALCALGLTSVALATPAPLLALDIGASIGGVDVGASIGHGSVADVGVGVGNAVGANASVGGGSVAGVDANVGGLDADVDVLGPGGSVVDACVGNCDTAAAPGTPGTPGTPGLPGTPGMPGTVSTAGASTLPPIARGPFICAGSGGNTTAFDGYPLMDRNGAFLGYVHSTRLGSGTAIQTVRIKTVTNRCATISKGGFTVSGSAMRAGFTAAQAGLAAN